MNGDVAPVAGEMVEGPFVAVLAALERLADQAWHTAGDLDGRERAHEDRAALRAAIVAARETAPAEATGLRERIEALVDEWEATNKPPWMNAALVLRANLRAALAVEAAGRDEEGES